jgi:hypothetical protein
MTFAGGVSATIGLICLVAAALMWTIGRRWQPRVIVVLVLTGMTGLSGSQVGGWVRTAVAWADGLAGRLTGQMTGVVLVGLVATVALVVVVAHLWFGTVSRATLLAALVLPVAVTTVPGIVGDVSTTAVTAVTSVVGGAAAAAFGL